MVFSKQNFKGFYKYEARIKLVPSSQGWGFFPAFWVFGWNTEIDFFEQYSRHSDKLDFGCYNWRKDDPFAYCDDSDTEFIEPCKDGLYGYDDNTDWTEDFHKYTCIYDNHQILFYLDDVLIHTINEYNDISENCNISEGTYLRNPAFPIPNEPVHVILNLALTESTNLGPNIFTEFPGTMLIDYVRVYEKDNCEAQNYIIEESTDEVWTEDKIVKSITINSGATLEIKSDLFFNKDIYNC
jgi:beta-glucanase (GH16 family)